MLWAVRWQVYFYLCASWLSMRLTFRVKEWHHSQYLMYPTCQALVLSNTGSCIQFFPCDHCFYSAVKVKFVLHINCNSGNICKLENLISAGCLWLLYHCKIKHSETSIPAHPQYCQAESGAPWANLYYRTIRQPPPDSHFRGLTQPLKSTFISHRFYYWAGLCQLKFVSLPPGDNSKPT